MSARSKKNEKSNYGKKRTAANSRPNLRTSKALLSESCAAMRRPLGTRKEPTYIHPESHRPPSVCVPLSVLPIDCVTPEPWGRYNWVFPAAVSSGSSGFVRAGLSVSPGTEHWSHLLQAKLSVPGQSTGPASCRPSCQSRDRALVPPPAGQAVNPGTEHWSSLLQAKLSVPGQSTGPASIAGLPVSPRTEHWSRLLQVYLSVPGQSTGPSSCRSTCQSRDRALVPPPAGLPVSPGTAWFEAS
ncbi:unnamed protein product [Gadus morhua 'NCC']